MRCFEKIVIYACLVIVGYLYCCIVVKTNIHDYNVGYYVPTCFRHLCNMLDTMFQHPGTVQCV